MGMFKISLILIIFLLVAPFLTITFYKSYIDNLRDSVQMPDTNLVKKNNSLSYDALNNSEKITFYDNIRFKNSKISYFISPDCSSIKVEGSRNAFKIIENETILEFYESDDNPEISIICSDEVKELNNSYFVAGEGGPDFIINTSRYNIILNGTVLLYKSDRCDEPVVVIHEILHVLGFKHSRDKKSILYPSSNCNQKITPEIINEIASLYKDPALADLTFIKLDARKKGFFLSFDAEIKNTGLADAEDVSLSIYDGDKLLEKYDLGAIGFGAGKLFKVTNAM